ncbi:MAG TPA: FCD domain-containing protein, partial [Agitococcus sp.]|nr:FCD domain-containing protein [Agitococcus sp.]
RLAAEHVTEEEVQGLKQLLQQHQQQTELQTGKGYYQEEGDFDLHYRIVKASRNDVLMQMLCGELYHRVRLYRYQFSVTEGRPHKAFAEHSRIIEAIEAKDGEMAELLMRRHISAARQNIQNRLVGEKR